MLFREEVRAAQAAQWLGSVRLHRPLSFSMVTACALGLALALVAFATWGEVNRKARLSGLLVPTQGSLNITAQQSGVLMELPIVEGQTVQAGDVLLVLNTEHRSLLQGAIGDTSERAARQIEARQQTLSTERTLRELQQSQREQVLSDRIRTLQAELRQSDEESNLQQRRVQLAQGTLARNEQLAANGLIAAAGGVWAGRRAQLGVLVDLPIHDRNRRHRNVADSASPKELSCLGRTYHV